MMVDMSGWERLLPEPKQWWCPYRGDLREIQDHRRLIEIATYWRPRILLGWPS